MVERIVRWLLRKAGVIERLERIEERLDEIGKTPTQASAKSAAELLNEWLNGGSD